MNITICTIAPQDLQSFAHSHVVTRAQALGQLDLRILDMRDYAGGSFRHMDDSPYGGGGGMILRLPPMVKALEAAGPGRRILLSPTGQIFDQKMARRFTLEGGLIFLCGHYEGVDARVVDYVDEEISLGQFILTGGESAVIPICDAIIRLLPGVVKNTENESFEGVGNLPEYPQYTRPADFEGKCVPKVLLSGNDAAIAHWRRTEQERLAGIIKERKSLEKR